MSRKILLGLVTVFILSLSIFMSGCKDELQTSDNFDISESIKLINSNINNENVTLIVSGNSDINEYINLLKKNFKYKKINFEIYIYDNDETAFDINSGNFDNLRARINFSSDKSYYTQYKYIFIPDINNEGTLLPFENEDVETIDGKTICKINIKGACSVEDIISTAKLYSKQVKELNTSISNIKVVINNQYEYETDNYLTLIENINLVSN